MTRQQQEDERLFQAIHRWAAQRGELSTGELLPFAMDMQGRIEAAHERASVFCEYLHDDGRRASIWL